MKKGYKIISGLICLLAALILYNGTGTVFAAGTIGVQCNDEEKKVTVTGTIPSGRPDRKIMMLVIRPNEFDNFKNTHAISKNVVYYVAQTITGSNGAYTFNFNLDPNVAAGKYNLVVGASYDDLTQQSYFTYVDESLRTEAVNELKSTNSVQEATTLLLNTYDYVFKLNTGMGSDYDNLINKSVVMSTLFNNRQQYTGIQQIQQAFDAAVVQQKRVERRAVIVQQMNGATVQSMEQEIINDNDELQLDLNDKYYNAQKEEVYNILEKITFTDIPGIQNEFYKAVAVAGTNGLSLSDRNGMGEILQNYRSYMHTPQQYWDYSQKVEVHKLLLASRPYKDTDAIDQAVSNALETLADEADNNNKHSGSSGGGGGGSSTRISVDPVVSVIPQVSSGTSGAQSFTDIDRVPWAQESINELSKMGVISGVGNSQFQPDENVTREEFLTMLIKAFGLVDQEAACNFSDVDKGQWYYAYIASAQKLGVSEGINQETFGVGLHITRQDMSSLAYRAAKIANVALDASNEDIDFADKDDIADYAVDSIAAMKKASIINGYENNKFEPNGLATRAQAAKIIYGLLKKR